MHLCFEPKIMYGFTVNDDDGCTQQIDGNYLGDHGIEVAPVEVIRGYACTWVYGVTTSFNDGKITVSKKERKHVVDFARRIGADKPGFMMVIEGDYESDCKYYFPDDKGHPVL